MQLTMLKSKLHRATVTQADLNYVGSITIDENLMEAAALLEYEKVQIVDINNGSRFETYVIKGKRGSGTICLNGAAARCVQPGDKIIIMSYILVTPEELEQFKPIVIFLDDKNQISAIKDSEQHGHTAPEEIEYDKDLFDKLRQLRRALADKEMVPPYFIFTDKTLKHLSAHKPKDMQEFAQIHGVGKRKMETYAEIFLAEINA